MIGDAWKASDIAAWWGAAVATFVLLLEAYKYLMSGPSLRVSVSANMQMTPSDPRYAGLWVIVNVVNAGKGPTTLTGLVGMAYVGRRRWLSRPEKRFVITPGWVKLPAVISSGESWSGYVRQDDVARYVAKGLQLYLGVTDSMSGKAKLAHVLL